MRKIFLCTMTYFMILIVFSSSGLTKSKKPKWINTSPRNQFFYIGIGFSTKKDNDYREKAVQKALANLANEISTEITATTDHVIEETPDEVKDLMKSVIQTASHEYLEGYEIVDEWQNDDQFWIYYRLLKEKHLAIKEKKLNDAKTLALDFFDKGNKKQELNDVAAALTFYLQAFAPLERHYNEQLDIEYDGVRIMLLNEIQSSIADLVSRISLTPGSKKVQGKYGRALKRPLRVNLFYESAPGKKIPAVNFPVSFEFVTGEAKFVNASFSDRKGKARSQVTKITSLEPVQIVDAKFDFAKLVSSAKVPSVFKLRVSGIPIPSTQFFIEVARPSVYVKTEEYSFGVPSETLIIEPELKNALIQSGFALVDDISQAEFEMTVQATSRKSSRPYQGFYTAWVDLVVSVNDLRSGRQIYKNAFKNIKGIKGDYNSASIAAFQKTATKLQNEIVPLIVAEIFQ